MARKPEIILFLLCALYAFDLNGQSHVDSAQMLKPVTVTQSRLRDHLIAPYSLPIDSAMLSTASNGSLTDLLRKQGLGHLRSYGQGGPALPSFRGTGSSHTAVLWNGISLVSPLSGQLDLSLLPVALFDDATIQTGGSASLAGNGAIGANIHLNNNVDFGQGLRATASSHHGSFSQHYHAVGFRVSNQKLGISTKAFHDRSGNDYPYTNRSVYPPKIQRRAHAAFERHGLLQQFHLQTQDAGIFSLKFWYQKSFAETPNPTSIPTASETTQDDVFYRAVAAWSISRAQWDLNYQTAFVRQELDYADPATDLFSSAVYNSSIHNLEANFNISNHSLLTTGIHYTWEEGVADDFGGSSPVRNRVALFSAYKIRTPNNWTFSLSAREEIADGKPMPLAPALSGRYDVSRKLNVFTNLSRNYRIPTFNDLYWKGVGTRGNPDLKTETSLSAESGMSYTAPTWTLKGVLFSNHVDNWILWNPEIGQVWMPRNVKKVWSRGGESQFSIRANVASIMIRTTLTYSFSRSTNVDVYETGNPNEIGKQLLLTPMHEGGLTLKADWERFALRVVNSYTGKQFNDSDNSPYAVVDANNITNVWLSKSFERENIRLRFTAEVNNVFDTEYVGRPGYPLPGRNFKAGVHVQFDKPNKK